ncbi:cytochrome-c peroxidase [Bradyrhizobium sp. WSM 1744]|uniref:Cytochrome-c peroxidase n=2 Tax=Bradyrhizobium archetypum TaxID=2721160 RepID=A0A7Y4M568_9BRAD|nr:cytochrome-c peroxidase [Bradyrhizobium archetypum]
MPSCLVPMRGIVKKLGWELHLVRKLSVAAVAMLASSQASSEDDWMRAARQIFKPIPSIMPAVKDNPVTHEKIELGKMLFFDPRLSASGIISCNSCHNLGTGGVDAGPTSVGHGWQQGPRRAPTVYNAVFNLAQFWDGRAADLKAQAKGPVQARVEMNATPDHVLDTLNSMNDYVVMFKKAFPNEASPVTFDNFAKAIEAFEATLITPAAPFDQYLEGDTTALNDQQKEGLKLFMETGCSSCHNGINVGGQGYFSFGVIERPSAKLLPASDKGRYAVTKAASDEYVFRAAPLRNVALRAPYFHSGQVWSLKEAVGVMGETQLGIELSDKEKNDIVAFLNSLTGQLPNIEYPKLPTRNEATPRPSLGR